MFNNTKGINYVDKIGKIIIVLLLIIFFSGVLFHLL